MRIKPISISLSPNTEKDDIWLAFRMIFQCWKWKNGKAIQKLEEEFKKYLNVGEAVSFNSGRSAFLAILSSLALNKNDEVLVQAFTCNAAINPIIWAELKPVYVDCDEKTFNIDVQDLKNKVTSKTRVVMVQHTFGLPADMDKILEVCREGNLILIEDCAHSLGAEYKGRKVGTLGRVSFFSFSRDKVISSVYGGMAVTNDDELAEKIKDFQKEIGYPSYCWILQQLLHPILMNWLILPTYKFFGKYLLVLFQWLHILSKAVHWKEKRGRKPGYFPKRLPSALACLALNQFKKLERFNNHRKEIARFYAKKLNINLDNNHIYLRFPIKHPRAHRIIKKARQKNLLIGDWYTNPIAPDDTKLDKLQYKLGSCPKAEKLAQQTLNLPTHINISKKQAQKIVDFILSLKETSSLFDASPRYYSACVIKDKNIWEDFLLGCKEKTFLQSWNWGEFQIKMGNKIWRLGMFNNGKLISVVLAVKIIAKRGTFLLLQHNLAMTEILLNKLKEIAKKENCSFIRVAPLLLRDKENKKLFQDLGFREAPMHASAYEATLKLDLMPGEAELLMNMRKTTRYLIRQALKNPDLEIIKSAQIKDVEIFEKLQREVVKKQNFAPFSFEFVKNEFDVFAKDNQALLFFGKYQGKITASALIIFWSGIGFYHHAALLPQYHKIPISYLLQWEAIKEAKRRGCLFYDFWGFVDPKKEPKHPWAGPTLFKLGFGGELYEYVKTQDLPLSWKYWPAYIFERLRKIKRGL